MFGVFVRYAANHRPFAAVDGGERRRRVRVVVARKVRRRRRRRREAAGVGDESDATADGTSDRAGARWQLKWRAAVGAVDQNHRGR